MVKIDREWRQRPNTSVNASSIKYYVIFELSSSSYIFFYFIPSSSYLPWSINLFKTFPVTRGVFCEPLFSSKPISVHLAIKSILALKTGHMEKKLLAASVYAEKYWSIYIRYFKIKIKKHNFHIEHHYRRNHFWLVAQNTQ